MNDCKSRTRVTLPCGDRIIAKCDLSLRHATKFHYVGVNIPTRRKGVSVKLRVVWPVVHPRVEKE